MLQPFHHLGSKFNRTRKPIRSEINRAIEVLEGRQLLSATSDLIASPDLTLSAAATSSTVVGCTPAQISQAYGFNQVSYSSGTIKGNSAGQTIAIVDAYNDPNIAADLNTFDAKFGLSSPASLKVVSQTGTSALPATSAGWATEIALDVEWAHAMAPAASILLVEAKSASLSDLLASVNYARHAAGVSVVSMSWGASEFSSETAYDSYFTTPAGHTGVTFVASAGDDGASSGPEWPASSSNVLSVGGTTLNLTTSGGYSNESGWSYGGGGVSGVEREPSYQYGVQSTGGRSSPDVAYDADPNTGFAVYDSLAYQGYSGWQEVGGTSAGAPQWAALVAIADQGRAIGGLSALDGATGTLPSLYALYSSSSTYTSAFNDIVSGRNANFSVAQSGYDTVTGLGSPKALAVVQALGAKTTATTTTGTTTPVATRTPFSPPRSSRAAETARETVVLETVPTASVAVDQAAAAQAPLLSTLALRSLSIAVASGPSAIGAAPTIDGDGIVTTRAATGAGPTAAAVGVLATSRTLIAADAASEGVASPFAQSASPTLMRWMAAQTSAAVLSIESAVSGLASNQLLGFAPVEVGTALLGLGEAAPAAVQFSGQDWGLMMTSGLAAAAGYVYVIAGAAEREEKSRGAAKRERTLIASETPGRS